MNKQTWNRDNKFDPPGKTKLGEGCKSTREGCRSKNVNTTPSSTPPPSGSPCIYNGHRRCGDGSCASRLDMCPEEQLVNQTTVFILITVGMVVIILLVILYCFQKRSLRSPRRRRTDQVIFVPILDEGDSTSLYMPPPAYEEVVSSSLYRITPALSMNERLQCFQESRTPPPNYDAALYILAHSHHPVCPTKEEQKSPVMRRSISIENVSIGNVSIGNVSIGNVSIGNTHTLQSSDPDFLQNLSILEPR